MVKPSALYLLLAAQVVAVSLPSARSRPTSEREQADRMAPSGASPGDEASELGAQSAGRREEPAKKTLASVDQLSNLDHRDYVVSDREFEMVLRRLNSGELPLSGASSAAPVRAGPDTRGLAPAGESAGYFECDECFICLEALQAAGCEMSLVEVSLFCGHRFHLSCIGRWARARQPRSGRCPVCIELLRLQNGTEFPPARPKHQ